MPVNSQIFANAIATRNKVLASQEKEIRRLYKEWANDIEKKIRYYEHHPASSSVVKARQMRELKKTLEEASNQVSNEIYKNVRTNAFIVAASVNECSVKWLAELGIISPEGLRMTNVEHRVVSSILNGRVYSNGWNLSKALWSDNQKTLKDIHTFLARGIAENKPTYEIAKDIERYINPAKAKPWNKRLKFSSDTPRKGFTFNPRTGKYEQWTKLYKGKVDYNAQRLARTITQHSYQQAFVEGTKDNPFVLKYQWVANGSRTCPLCKSRNGQLYKKDALPLDHPNGMCTIQPVIDDKMNDKLANWLNSPEGTYPEIDEFASSFGSKAHKTRMQTGVQNVQEIRSYTDRQIKSASKFLKEFEFDDASIDSYMNVLKSTEQEFQNAFVDALKKKVKNWEYSDEECSFSRYRKEIKLSDNAINAWLMDLQNADVHMKQSLFHEIGHAIDDMARGSNAAFSKSSKFKFKEAMIKDMKEMNNKVKSNDVDFIRSLNDMIKDDSSKGIQDAISAMHCKGIGLKDVKAKVRVKWSHSQEYYERTNAKNEAASELFANICGAKADPKAQEYMKKYFPNALKEFERIIKEIGK